jgi:Kyakuja-Dileera-Zisupton transposase
MFATSAMHAYGHQWACQLVYNPRLRKGLGLTDGEGVERLWSRLRKLIGITRSSGVSKHHLTYFHADDDHFRGHGGSG